MWLLFQHQNHEKFGMCFNDSLYTHQNIKIYTSCKLKKLKFERKPGSLAIMIYKLSSHEDDSELQDTVELRSKGPATKGNRSLRDNGAQSRLFPFSFLLLRIPARWDMAIRETPVFGKDFSVPW